jgi:ribosomal protein S18 acetylase RimI-like enzyme
MRSPDYEPALDLVAVGPDGTLAAYVLCRISAEENALTGRSLGYTDPVATHPDYQRLGLAKALLLVGCKKLRERGVETVALGTGSWNTGMRKAAESVGYRVISKKYFFEKSLRL